MSDASFSRLRVLQGIGVQDGDKITNPYTALLVESLSPLVVVELFSWRKALVGGYDVVHLHWPELMVRGRGLRRLVKPALFSVFLMRTRILGTPVVQTAHNLKPHENGSKLERRLLSRLNRQTSAWIVMNHSTPTPNPDHTYFVPHGHYRTWYRQPAMAQPDSGSLLFFGSIRGYKGIDDLLNAVDGSDVALRIAGRPSDLETRRRLERFAQSNPKVTTDLRFVPDDVLSAEIARAERVILPYRNLHNSGAVLLSLSLNRPVIVPRTPATQELVREFGPQWVLTYEGDLDRDTLRELTERDLPATGSSPDMSSREWNVVAKRTSEIYLDAVARMAR